MKGNYNLIECNCIPYHTGDYPKIKGNYNPFVERTVEIETGDYPKIKGNYNYETVMKAY